MPCVYVLIDRRGPDVCRDHSASVDIRIPANCRIQRPPYRAARYLAGLDNQVFSPASPGPH